MPTPTPAWAQIIIGMTLGAIVAVAATSAGLLRIPTTIYHWLAFFAVIWIVTFFALRRKRTILVIAAFVTCTTITFFVNHFLL